MQTIGKYQVEKVLGRGGMGTVYQAHDPVLHRTVALKTMTPGLTDAPELKARFLREAQAAGGLRHHNIVTVYDLGDDLGQPYIAMELIEGADLEHIIQRREPLSVEWKIDVVRQVCEGLAYAHRNGIVHRDVKPANIRVTPEGEVKIMDFGIAHLQSSTMTKGGTVLGTIHYMAPEQVEGGKVDHRADIFSVGAIAYELLTYRRPFDGESLSQVMVRIVRDTPDFAAIPKSAYSPGLERVVERALAKAADDRYQSLDEMRDDLGLLVRDTAVRLAAVAEGIARDTADLVGQIATARAAGQLQKALTLSRRLLAKDPAHAEGLRLFAEVEAAIRDKEVEQLATLALGYAADGDLDLGAQIAARVGAMAPESVRYRELRAYLDDERSRRAADLLVATAQERIVRGEVAEARAAAEEALARRPDHALAREIRDRAAAVLDRRGRAAAPPPSAPAPPPPSPPAAAPPTPPTPSAATAAPPAPPALPTRSAATRSAATPADPRPAEAAALTTAALDAFLRNDHARARRTVEKALALDPTNRRARELLAVLGVLG